MNRLCSVLLLLPNLLWAQTQDTQTIQRQDLKPIGSDLVPAYGGYRYGPAVQTQYTYNGLDIKAKQLVPYILASGDPNAIREINAYMSNRRTGGWLIAGGVTSMLVGTVLMASNSPGSDGKFTTQQPFTCPPGYMCGVAGVGTVRGGQTAGSIPVTDTRRQRSFTTGYGLLLGGGVLTGVGWGLNIPGRRVRRAVQYYNRSLQHEQGVRWKVSPGAPLTAAGIRLSGQF